MPAAWKRIHLPGSGGVVKDRPPWELAQNQLSAAQDFILKDGIPQQRFGWEYDGTVADDSPASTNEYVFQNAYILANTTKTNVITSSGHLFTHNAAAVGTDNYGSFLNPRPIPRGVYKDQQWLCYQNGTQPAELYSGSGMGPSGGLVGTLAPTMAVNNNTLTVTAGTVTGSPDRGAYCAVDALGALADRMPKVYLRVVEPVSASVIAVDMLRPSAAGVTAAIESIFAIGFPYPCVNIFEDGTVTYTLGTTATVTGANWSTGIVGGISVFDALLARTGNTSAFNYHIIATTATTVTIKTSSAATNQRYAIMRRCPFKDAQAHKGSLFGAGVAQYPGRVYVSPPDWNPAGPPGLTGGAFTTPTLDMAAGITGVEDFFMLDEVNVPAQYDGDPIVALIPTPGPLLVLKQRSVYGIYGTYPNFEVRLLSGIAGQGCIDIRSAISRPEGAFWSGREGVFTFDGQRVINLTDGAIRDEWTRLARAATTSVCEVTPSGHLIAQVGTTMYAYDLTRRVWLGTVSNATVNHMTRTGTQALAVFGGLGAASRVADLNPMFAGVKANGTTAADPYDDVATGPQLSMTLPENLHGDPDQEARVLRVATNTNVHDTGAAGASRMTVALTSSGRVGASAETAVTALTIDSDTTDVADRKRAKVNAVGRRHRLTVTGNLLLSTTLKKMQLHEVAMEVRPMRDGR